MLKINKIQKKEKKEKNAFFPQINVILSYRSLYNWIDRLFTQQTNKIIQRTSLTCLEC